MNTNRASTISRRQFLKASAGAVGLLATAPYVEAQMNKKTSRPNLLVIHTDQQSLWSISAYGSDFVSTPHIDSLAKEGVKFTNFFTNHSVCTASRGCFLTGLYPSTHGAWKNDVPLTRSVTTLAHSLRKRGYDTGYSGKWHLDGPPKPGWMKPERSMGFTDCRFMFNRGHWKKITEQGAAPPKAQATMGGEKDYTTDWLATKTIDFIREKRENPFFYMVSIPDPHTPFTVRSPYDRMFKAKDMPLPSTLEQPENDKPTWARNSKQLKGKKGEALKRTIRRSKAQYCGEVKCIDDNVGRILDALRKTGELDNTIVVFTTDHGEFMGEHGLMHKGKPYDTAYRIPMLIRWPARLKKGTVVDNVWSTVDFMPSILSFMGIKPPARIQGRDASSVLMGQPTGWIDEAFMHLRAGASHVGIWTPQYELAYVRDSDAILFDRKKDPDQVNNLFGDPSRKPVVKELTDRLIAHCETIKDPQLPWLKKTVSRTTQAS